MVSDLYYFSMVFYYICIPSQLGKCILIILWETCILVNVALFDMYSILNA